MITASAPGKLILFGEHAVVYGEGAIATAVDKRARVTVCELDEKKIVVSSKNFGAPIDAPLKGETDHPAVRAAQAALEYAGQKVGIGIEIDSKLPIAAGMGSSAAISSATAAAVINLLTGTVPSLEISNVAYEGEKIAHGKPSGIDSSVATFGGTIFFQRGKITNLETGNLTLVVGDTGIQKSTKELVEKVRSTIEDPRVAHSMFSIGSLVKRAKTQMLEVGSPSKLGILMDQNHDFLRKLGVSSVKLEELVKAAKKAGAYGAKLTGAGGGGCIIALTDEPQEVIDALKAAGAKRAFTTKTNQEGVRIEG